MPDMMIAARKMRADAGLDICEVPIPSPGTDLQIWNWDGWARGRIRPPRILGHEFCGTIVEVGSMVRTVQIDDYVSAESHVTCGMCYQCRTGQAHMCPKTEILGVDRDGAFANYVVLPEKVIWKNDRTRVPPQIATLQEPFGNAVFASMLQNMSAMSVAVLGCGPIGLFCIAIARAVGAKAIYASDLHDFRIQLAKQMGASMVFDASDARLDLADYFARGNGERNVDIVLEMSGAGSAIRTAFDVVRVGGTVVLFGIPSEPVKLDVANKLIFKNLKVFAINGRRIFDTWYQTRSLLESKRVDLEPLISQTIPLGQINAAMELLQRGDACKIVLLPNDGKPAPLVSH